MRYPNLNEEKKLWRKGHKIVIGLDEAGRGPLAGPVVAAAVMMKEPKMKGVLKEVKDSKKLTPWKREEIYDLLKGNAIIEWGIGRVSEKVIDRINILEATKLAMKRAVKNLKLETYNSKPYLVIDGNFPINLNTPQKSIIKADEKVFSCALASIVAKVARDRMMIRYHKKYPQYGFDKHKGYPTWLHRQMLKKYNPSVIHRMTFTLSKK